MAGPHLEERRDAHGRDAPSWVCHNHGWRPDADHVVATHLRRAMLGDSVWIGTAQLGCLSSRPIYYRVPAADDAVLMALLRWTVIGPATGPGCHRVEQRQSPGLDWEVQTRWGKHL